MFRRKANKETSFTRQWSLIALSLLILFSSCTTKRGIKTLLDIPVSTTQPIKDSKNNALRNLLSYCSDFEELKILTTSSGGNLLSDNLMPYGIRSEAYSFIVKHLFTEVKTIPNYYTPNIFGEVPKYILLQKLVLYNA